MKVVICWAGVSGYLTACWRALAAKPGIDLRLAVFPAAAKARPFVRERYDWSHISAHWQQHYVAMREIMAWATTP